MFFWYDILLAEGQDYCIYLVSRRYRWLVGKILQFIGLTSYGYEGFTGTTTLLRDRCRVNDGFRIINPMITSSSYSP